jgi:hypothetical protein
MRKQVLEISQLKLSIEDNKIKIRDNTSTFVNNLSLPVHRWFRYSAGFSAQWVRDLIIKEKINGRKNILDPFVGSGTVLIEGEYGGMNAFGIEAHPFVSRVAKAKLNWRANTKDFIDYASIILSRARIDKSEIIEYPPLVKKCFPEQILIKLHRLKTCFQKVDDKSGLSELIWLAIASILRECSPVGTAQWQYILPNKKKAKITDPYRAFEAKINLMADDMQFMQYHNDGSSASIFMEDARECPSVPNEWADIIITSPPYANNYDYADATRLEMSFFGEINGWGDLQNNIRKYLIRSCTQHVSKLNVEIPGMLEDPILAPIKKEIIDICNKLARERKLHGGQKPYHALIAAYFSDLAKTWITLRRVTKTGGKACFVIGDSAPYGIYVPVEKWLGELALSANFKSFTFEKIRDRNIKWKNRKHRVPLKEGILWVEG